MQNRLIRTRRICAFLADYLISLLPCILCTAFVRIPAFNKIAIILTLIGAISFFILFILRDYLFQGRSIGKRIFNLTVLDAGTQSEPSSKQLIIKNLFLFLYPIDGIFLLTSRRSLGERASCTMVVSLSEKPCSDILPDVSSEASEQSKSSVKKCIAVATTVTLCIALFMFCIISAALNAVKKQDNYQIAYTYLISSEHFAKTPAEESQIILTAYSSSTRTDGDNETVSSVVTFTFLVQGQQYEVVCHQDNDRWYVCTDCTNFR